MTVTAIIVGAIAVAGGAGTAFASGAGEKPPVNPEDAVTGPSNTAPGSASEYWTDERKRNATGG